MSSSSRVILVGVSAWIYWETNPLIRESEIPDAVATIPYPAGGGIPAEALALRKDANEATRLVASRLRFDLKNLPLPIHVCAEATPVNKATRLLVFHAYSSIPDSELFPIGGNLYVVSPTLALAQLAVQQSPVELAQRMLEACGIYAISSETDATRFAIDRFQQAGMLTKQEVQSRSCRICEYYDEHNRRVSFTDAYGNELPWEPCFDRFGRRTNMWKRPPLTTAAHAQQTIEGLKGMPGLDATRKAVRWVTNGSGSPLESKWALITGVNAYNGGEAWHDMLLNRRIVFPPELQDLAGQRRCAADQLLPGCNAVIEINGKDFHADRDGFVVHSGRRSALEALGYHVFEVNYHQMRNLDAVDAILETIAARTHIQLRKRSPAFIRKRYALHSELFPTR